jgi:large subunit ribosomal protein L25
MKTLEIKGSTRTITGKKESRLLRQQGKVPCVIYGGEKNIHFSADRIELEKLVYTPEVYLLKLDLEGKVYNGVMKDIQFHPVSEEILHIDFIQVFEDQKLTMNLPIELTGSSVGIRSGGKLRQRRRQIKVHGLIKDMPDRFAVDMSDLDIGDFLKVGDLSYENLEILDPPRAMVVGVVSSRLIAKGLREEVVEEEAVEGEVVEEGEEQVESGEAPETSAEKEDTTQEG